MCVCVNRFKLPYLVAPTRLCCQGKPRIGWRSSGINGDRKNQRLKLQPERKIHIREIMEKIVRKLKTQDPTEDNGLIHLCHFQLFWVVIQSFWQLVTIITSTPTRWSAPTYMAESNNRCPHGPILCLSLTAPLVDFQLTSLSDIIIVWGFGWTNMHNTCPNYFSR